VLVLSRHAGAANDLEPGALLVDPGDQDSVVAALRRAFAMSPAERAFRVRIAQAHLREHDVHRWAASFLEALEGDDRHGKRLQPDPAAWMRSSTNVAPRSWNRVGFGSSSASSGESPASAPTATITAARMAGGAVGSR
jgi:trehalose-6-phosphate synthase